MPRRHRLLITSLDHNSGLLTDFGVQSRSLLQVGADNRQALVSATRHLATFTRWLRAYQPQLYATLAHACQVARRNLSDEEWRSVFGSEPYRETCPRWGSS